MNIFEKSVREKMRFPFRGVISVEDLWDLSVKDLDAIFKTLNSQLKQVKEESLLETKTKEDVTLDTQIAIVKYIVKIKLEEEKTRLEAKDKKEKKQKLLEILASKQDESLQNKSVEEIQNMIAELDS